MIQSRQCENCGSSASPTDSYCSNCGVKIPTLSAIMGVEPNWYHYWLGFGGRISRGGFIWRQFVAVLLIFVLASVIAVALETADQVVLVVGLIVLNIGSILMGMAIHIFATVRRFHDLGTSGWWYILLFVPFISLWLSIKLLFFVGEADSNRFGDKPELDKVGR